LLLPVRIFMPVPRGAPKCQPMPAGLIWRRRRAGFYQGVTGL
jgi:hypothetical protein